MRKSIFLIGLLASLFACEMSVTTARLSNLQLCSELTEKGACVQDVNEFEMQPDTIYVTGSLSNAPKGTEIRYYWYQILDDEVFLLDSVSYKSQNSAEIVRSFITTANLALGKYRVAAKIIADNREQWVRDFEFKRPHGISMNMDNIGTWAEENGRVTAASPVLKKNDRTVYYSSVLYNLPPNTLITVGFRDVSKNEMVKVLELTNGDEKDDAILLTANLNRDEIDLSTGQHEVVVEIDGKQFATVYTIE
jgi:hypothetical protein